MAVIDLHLTCDHELFGDGSGSLEHCMIRPAERMMDICEKHRGKLTFFFDVCMYWAFKDLQDKGGTGAERPADRLEEHVKGIVRRGHQVQLHFHPQWLHYTYHGPDRWELDYRMWRLPEVEKYWEEGGERPLYELFRRGKETLVALLQKENPAYRCEGFRAGAWGIQPEEKVLEAMEENGFAWDSTVMPGKKLEAAPTVYDFTGAPWALPHWTVGRNVQEPDEQGGIEEYPIFTEPLSGWMNGRLTLLKARKKVPLKPEGCSGSPAFGSGKSGAGAKLKKLSNAFRSGYRTFNFTDGTTFEEMKFMAERAIQRYRDREGHIPLVAIGHTKTFGNEQELRDFLVWVDERADIHLTGGGKDG